MSVLLKAKNICVHFPVKQGVFSKTVGYVRAVDNVSLSINKGEVVGLVGESGCGKTTFGRALLRLIEPNSGSIIFNDEELIGMPAERLREKRKEMQIIFQDPYSSLNPRMTVYQTISEVFKIHKLVPKKEIYNEVIKLLDTVGLSPEHANRYPHEFSGGQRQRVGIARALALRPAFIVADEPVSALDVSIQSQILNLLRDLQRKMNLAMLFVSHDLRVVHHIADRIMVMYMGRIVEIANVDDLYSNPLHPYTKALISAVPIPDPKRKRERIVLSGDVPDPSNPPSGCPFHPRCPEAVEECKTRSMELWKQKDGRAVACLKYS